MLEQYKVLGAMLLDKDFTIREIAETSGVKESYIRTVINRHKAWIKVCGKQKNKLKGGDAIKEF